MRLRSLCDACFRVPTTYSTCHKSQRLSDDGHASQKPVCLKQLLAARRFQSMVLPVDSSFADPNRKLSMLPDYSSIDFEIF